MAVGDSMPNLSVVGPPPTYYTERLRRIQLRLNEDVWSRPEYGDVEDEFERGMGTGSHSWRKFAADYAASSCGTGMTSDEIETRARYQMKRWFQFYSNKVVKARIEGKKKKYKDIGGR